VSGAGRRGGRRTEPSARVRLDTWLWAARFFKTRSLAAQAVDGGKIRLNGETAKRAKPVEAGDEIRVRIGPFEHQVLVTGLAERRGPAAEAARLYRETEASLHARRVLGEQLKLAPSVAYGGKGRPTKRDRRAMDRLRDDDW